jgi:hypothetical protein
MPENATQKMPLPTIWRVPEELWEIIEPILEEHDPPKSTGRAPLFSRHSRSCSAIVMLASRSVSR